MSNRPDGTKVQLNFKLRNGDLINIYADSAQELDVLVQQVEGITPQIMALAGVLHGAQSAAGIAAPPSQQAPAQAGAVEARDLYDNESEGPACDHGLPTAIRSGNTKGRDWTGKFCRAKVGKAQQCKAVFK